jgi:hypothetical protein
MDSFEKQLEALAGTFNKDDELRAARLLFERSEQWREHKRHHDEQGTVARIKVWEELAPAPEHRVLADDEPLPERKHIKVGGCECQPRFAFMQADEKGGVTAGIPAPVEEAKAYNSVSGGTPTYGAKDGSTQTTYTSNPGEQRELYR